MKEIVEEKLNWIIFQSDDPDTRPAEDDRKARKFRDGNMLFHGALWTKWQPLSELLKVN